ncbi:phospholipase A2, membrane associated-like [Alexandromys fortis]|uniref:phospholipase A2, membrane associated-like n=1 Tax=Alexandromys fortis TaxID=100897 RepID=UPI00215214C0|nr:phospholipase A2, membrane associated-like [Microtus fortis]
MKVLLLLTAVIMAFGPIQIQGSLAEFRQMILLKTGKRAETSYAFYGCHCGVGGRGSPKDATDRCCVAHDCCYDRLQKHNCGTKFLTYKFSYRGGKITCSDTLELRECPWPPMTGGFPSPRLFEEGE